MWPELLRELQKAGWRNYSLFLRDDGLLVGYVESDDLDAAQERVARTEVNARWQAAMASLFGTEGAPDEALAADPGGVQPGRPAGAAGLSRFKDVATLAGVSVGTVSNVLNSPDLVSPATQERVRQAIEKLGWVRNESTRQLRAGRSRSVAMVVIDIANPFFTDVVLGAEDHFHSAGYAVHVGNSAQTAEREVAPWRCSRPQRVRGILVASIREMTERIAELRRRGIAVVLVDRMSNGSDSCSVAGSTTPRGRPAGRATPGRTQGHRTIAFVGGPSSLHQVRDRRMGAELASARAGDQVVLLAISTRRSTSGRASGRPPSSQRCRTASGRRRCSPRTTWWRSGCCRGSSLPAWPCRTTSIIGYDDIAFAAAAAVPLSWIRQPRAELGRRAAELLLAEIEAADGDGSHQHEQVRFVPELVVRSSTAALTRTRRTP